MVGATSNQVGAQQEQKSVRLSGNIRDAQNIRQQSETWDNVH